ncbi:MAG: hypothetical protein R6X32_03035 [Chloroflexota bacterium]
MAGSSGSVFAGRGSRSRRGTGPGARFVGNGPLLAELGWCEWVNGRLAAAMWTVVVLENTTTGEQRATDLSIAAVYSGTPSRLKPQQSH